MKSLKNVSLNEFREFLLYKGLKKIRTSGGHEVWSASNLLRPVILQTHINPIPEFIIRNNLRVIGATKQEFIDYFDKPQA